MKVCFISTYGYPLYDRSVIDSGIGGTEVQLYYLTNSLKEYFDISIIVSDYGQLRVMHHDRIIFFRAMNLEKKIKNYLLAPFLFFRALEMSKANIFVVSPGGPELYMTALYCFLRNKKFIHRIASETETDGTMRGKFLKIVQTWSLEKASVVVAQTKIQHMQLWKNYRIESEIIANGFPIKQTVNLKKNGILWVARTVSWKRPELAIGVADAFPKENFIMIASGQGTYHEKIRSEASRRDNITFHDHVPFHDIQDYYDRARIFLSTSVKEGFPNSFLQACIGATPIVSFQVDPDGFLHEFNTGIMVNGNFSQAKKAIDRLLKGDDDWRQMSKNAYEYISSHHEIRTTGMRWKKLIEEIHSKKI